MEITTKEISQNLKKSILSELSSYLSDLRDKGFDDRRLQSVVIKHVDSKIKRGYRKNREPVGIGGVASLVIDNMKGNTNDSKAEVIFYEFLIESGIPFKFQYKIGPYKVDYLIDGSLVVELDGPHHNRQKEYDEKRDKYIEKMGYTVLRIPISDFMMGNDAVLGAINEAR